MRIKIPYCDATGYVFLNGRWECMEKIEERGMLNTFELVLVSEVEFKRSLEFHKQNVKQRKDRPYYQKFNKQNYN